MTGLARQHLQLIQTATDRLLGSLDGFTDEQARQPSRLPGWSRGHVLTHVARNADGMCNLLTWARTGVPTLMYREPNGRNADIEAGSGRPAAELVQDVADSAGRWQQAAEELSDADWQAEVRRRPTLPPERAMNLLNGRLLEVEFHHVDLGLGYRLTDSPAAVLDEALGYCHRRYALDVTFLAVLDDGRRLPFPAGAKPSLEVLGSAADLLGWITGRGEPPGSAPSAARYRRCPPGPELVGYVVDRRVGADLGYRLRAVRVGVRAGGQHDGGLQTGRSGGQRHRHRDLQRAQS
ncbi:MAG TPA: maleylpyruvate isomerase family mycothiol-dependent enzyme [Jatrophihabitans sp.]|nr:maleylpyruvate isomerase family mycothiol-dependent enzyme [Jatrophihabitans sp.]